MSGQAAAHARMTKAVLRVRVGTFTAYTAAHLDDAEALPILLRKVMTAAAKQAIRINLDPNEALCGTLKIRPPLESPASGAPS